MILIVLLFWIYLFLLTLVFDLQWLSLRDHLRDLPWDDIFKFGASAAARAFSEWVQVGTDRKYQVRKYQKISVKMLGLTFSSKLG